MIYFFYKNLYKREQSRGQKLEVKKVLMLHIYLQLWKLFIIVCKSILKILLDFTNNDKNYLMVVLKMFWYLDEHIIIEWK